MYSLSSWKGRELFQSAAFLGTCTLRFLFCELSAWGCSAGQEGGNFLACNSYELLSIRLYALFKGDCSSLASASPQNKIYVQCIKPCHR